MNNVISLRNSKEKLKIRLSVTVWYILIQLKTKGWQNPRRRLRDITPNTLFLRVVYSHDGFVAVIRFPSGHSASAFCWKHFGLFFRFDFRVISSESFSHYPCWIFQLNAWQTNKICLTLVNCPITENLNTFPRIRSCCRVIICIWIFVLIAYH